MSKSSYVLKIQKGSTVYTCDLYTTQEEARSTVYPTYRLFKVNINGQTLYAPFTSTLNNDGESTPLVCPIFLSEGTDTLYCVAQKSYFRIAITTKENETITVTASNKPVGETGTGSYPFTSGSHWFPYGTTWTASVAGATGYNAGSLSPGTKGTLTNANVTVTAGAASLKTFVLTLAATTHQTIKIQYQPRNADGTMGSWTSDIASGSSAKTYTLRYGSKYKVTSFAAATGWNHGTLKNGSANGAVNTEYTLTGAITISATAATHKTYVLTLAAESHQTITLYYKNHNGSTLATSWTKKTSTSSDQQFTLGHGSQWYATIAGATGWNAGTISSAGTEKSPNTLTAAHTVNATAATHKTFTLKATSEAHQTLIVKYKNYNGSTYAKEKQLAEGDSVTVGYGTTWTASVKADTGYKAGALSPGTKGTVTANTTISVTNATAIECTVTFNIGGTYPRFTVTYKNKSGTTVTSGQNPTSINILSHTTITITCTMSQGKYVDAKCIADTSIINCQIYGGNSKATAKITKNIKISIVGDYNDGA